ncbi:MAG: PAS domain-containing protein [Polyangiaceae bacterium]
MDRPLPSAPDAADATRTNASGDFVAALDHMFEGLQVIDRQWRYLFVNDTAARHGRMSKSQLLGSSMVECYPGIDETPMFQRLEKAMGGKSQRFENEFTHADGQRQWFELHVQPHPDGIIVLSYDITERKLRERELRRRERELEAILQCVPSGVIRLDARGRVVAANPMAKTLLRGDRVDGAPLFEVAELRDADGNAIAIGYGVTHMHGEVCTLVRGDGSKVEVAASEAELLDEHGKTFGVIVTLLDVSEARKLEAQLHHAQRMEAIGRLASGVAHDFNNLLTVILSFGSFVQEALEEGTPASEDMREIMDATDRATAVTRQLLAFSARRPVRPVTVDLGDSLMGLDKLLRRLLDARTTLTMSLQPELWPVSIDPGAFEQVIVNLAVNARDAMANGGRLVIEAMNQHVSSPQAAAKGEAILPGDYVVVAVTDEGEGIPRELAEKVFDPFFTTKGPEKGTGLGLSTCYGIARQAGGHISVYSEPEVGTTFRLYLPRACSADSHATPSSTDTSPVRGNELILVAEDDPTIRQLVVRTLEARGFRTLVASTPHEAAELLEAHEETIDLLITDVIMPGGTGPELATHVERHRGPTRTLFMSGYTATTMLRDGAFPANAQLLPKPFGPGELLQRVAEVLGR